MHTQDLTPIGSLWLSGLLALVPLAVLLSLLGGFRLKAHWASLSALAAAFAVAIAAYRMPVGQALDAAALGIATSLLIIVWLTFNSVWIYRLTVRSGHFAVLRRSFAAVSDDQRIQALVIAFSFGALLEALAGGGAPVAICAVMLIAVGFTPIRAAVVALVANTAPVAYGGMANPIVTLSRVTELPDQTLAATVGRQAPFLALVVPFVLVLLTDGRRGVQQVWPAALLSGVSFAVLQFVVSNVPVLPYKLTDIAAALGSAAALVLFLRVWRPAERVAGAPTEPLTGGPAEVPVVAGGASDEPGDLTAHRDSRADVVKAYAPYAIIVLVFSIAQVGVVKQALESMTYVFDWPGLHVVSEAGEPIPYVYTLNWASAPGTLLFLSGLITLAVLRLSLLTGLRTYAETIRQFGWAIFTILCVFALAYLMNVSGQTATLGLWLAGTGAFFAFLSPVVGWFGVTITGTDAGSNALFGKLQVTAAQQIGLPPELLAAANSTGGVLGKMISTQSLAVATAAVGIVGQEGVLFRRIFGWSLGLLLVLCVLVYLQSTPVLGWMVGS